MPSYLSRSARTDDDRIGRAIELASVRFPELALTHRFALRETDTEVWLCSAPSAAHVERWSEESRLVIGPVRRIDERPLNSPQHLPKQGESR